LFSKLLDDALEHSQAANEERSTRELELKINRLRLDWGDRKAAQITEIVRWQACFSLVFRVALENETIDMNPASRIRRKAENSECPVPQT
jgi:hypothetical protein